MKTHVLVKAIVLAMALPLSINALGAAQTASAEVTNQVQANAGYLGVVLGPVPGAMHAQLASILPAGQGVMIRHVAADSPAAKAGLNPYDILLTYGDQKLFSAEQLSQLVKSDNPNRSVAIKLVRNGVMENVNVTLGEAKSEVTEEAPAQLPWMPMWHRYTHPMAPLGGPTPETSADNWETFDSLSLEKRQDGSYQAKIQYRDVNGKLVSQQFIGSREEIRQQVLQQSDLPPVERDQLLDEVSARDDGGWPDGPFGYRMFMPHPAWGHQDY
ncbi:MAG: PDZ domain-containing protein [Gammaproteobacteria bacterium]|nr:PDZ domain-containing protein [Gammaproteobacteria bacterium]